METGKTGKYLKYAIGEIVLVVIGILLALQINNWNEGRKQEQTLNSIYLITKEDLINDISEIDSFIKDYEERREPSFEAVLNTNLTKEDWIKNPQYISVLTGYKDFAINQRGFELLKSQSNLAVNMQQDLASRINLFYNQHITEIDIAIDELGNDFENNNHYFKNFDWFSSFTMNREKDGMIDYISNNPNVKSRIAFYYVLYRIYATELISFKTNAEKLIILIDNHLMKD